MSSEASIMFLSHQLTSCFFLNITLALIEMEHALRPVNALVKVELQVVIVRLGRFLFIYGKLINLYHSKHIFSLSEVVNL